MSTKKNTHFDSQVQSTEPLLGDEKLEEAGLLSFMQHGKVYIKTGINTVKKISVRKSKFLERSQVLTHTVMENKCLTYSSDFCVAVSEYYEEKRSASVNAAFLCPFCGMLFGEREKLHKQHIHLHSGPVKCLSCSKMIKDNYCLIGHKKNCFFKCMYCGKQFRQQTRFIIHKRVHTGI